jgi:hypothetical protein
MHTHGQENLGAVQDNYSPVNAALINPSSIADQFPWIDINIIGVAAYARTNSIFLPNSYLPSPSKVNDPFAKDPQEHLYGYVSAQVLGPSISIAIKDHSFGFHSAARGIGFIKKIPSPTATLIEELKDARVPDGRYFERNIRLKELVWEEYGLTYARILYKRNKDMWQGGITINRLYGAHAGGVYINNGELDVVNEEGNLINLDGKYWYNEPARRAGKGFSGSLGFTYKRMKKDISNYVPHSVYGSCVVARYKHKFGVSLVDIGAIRFKQSALQNSFDENTNIDSIETLADASDQAIRSSESNSFLAWLPSAASVQYDYNLERGFYFNVTAMQRLSFPSWIGTERASLYSAGLRFERKAFSIALPFSLHEYRYTQLGCSIRLWSLILGTDNLIPLIKRQDVYAADLYLYFKIPIFKSPPCRARSTKERKNRGVMDKYLCPVW